MRRRSRSQSPPPRAGHPASAPRDTAPSDTFTLIADGLAVLWIVVIGAQYALVLLLPGAPDVSGSYPALLAGVGIAGIMSYLRRRSGAA